MRTRLASSLHPALALALAAALGASARAQDAPPADTNAAPAPVGMPVLPGVDEPDAALPEPLTPGIGTPLSWRQAMEIAADHAVDLAIARGQVDQARAETRLARSELYPQATLNSAYEQRDEDRSETSGDTLAEQRTTVGGGIRQVLFDDGVWSALRAAGLVEEGRALQLEQTRLDVIHDAGGAFLDYQKSLAVFRIEVENLDLTTEIMAHAVRRLEGGAGLREDVLRWESQQAGQRGRVRRAYAQTEAARIVLNNRMGLNADSRWQPDVPDLTGSAMYELGRRLATLREEAVSAPLTALTHVGEAESPGLRALDKAIEAQRRLLERSHRAYYTPRVEAQFQYNYILDQQFAGESTADVLRRLGLPTDNVATRDDEEWTGIVALSFPFLEGGGKTAAIERDVAAVSILTQTRERARQGIEQAVQDSIYALRGSHPTVAYSRRAAELSRENLDLLEDKYKNGAVMIVQVIDAQSDAHTKELEEALAAYRLLADLHELQYGLSWFEAFHTDAATRQRLGGLLP